MSTKRVRTFESGSSLMGKWSYVVVIAVAALAASNSIALGAGRGNCCDSGKPLEDGQMYYPVKGSAWRLAVADVTGDGKNELIYGAYDGAVRCQDLSSGKIIWEVSTNSFPFSIAARDVNHDGKAEVFAAAADGGLYAIKPDGKLLWIFRSKLPLYNVAVGDIQPGGDLEIACGGIDRNVYILSSGGKEIARSKVARLVHRLAVGNLDNDRADEVFVVDANGNHVFAEVWGFENDEYKMVWRKPIDLPDEWPYWESGGKFHPYSVDIGDLDGDGISEILMGDTFYNEQAVMAMSADGNSLWFYTTIEKYHGEEFALYGERFTGKTHYEYFGTAFVKTGEIEPDSPGKEVVVAAGGEVTLLDKNGNALKEASAPVGFTDVVLDDKVAYLGSSPNGDNTVYRISMDDDWVPIVNNFQRQGIAKKIGENLAKLRKQVLAYQEDKTENHAIHTIMIKPIKPNDAFSYQKYKKKVEWYRSQFPYENLKYATAIGLKETTPPLDEKGNPWWGRKSWRSGMNKLAATMTKEEIEKTSQWIEEHKIPTFFWVNHVSMPFISVETAEKMLKAAPKYLMGFRDSESSSPVPRDISRFYKYHYGPLADLCVKYGYKKCIIWPKATWWMSVPSIKSVYDELFRGERWKVIAASTVESNSRNAEINLMARTGLWLAGLIEPWNVSMYYDTFTFSWYHLWAYHKHGHPYFRLLAAHTLMGGINYNFTMTDIRPEGDSFQFTDVGREYIEIFLHMLGKEIIFTPKREEVVGMSRVGIAVHEPPAKWLRDAHNFHGIHIWKDDPELHNAVIPHNGVMWGNTETPEHALQKVLLEKKRQFGYNVPATPYGPFVIVPVHADLSKVPLVEEWWHTDGIYVWQEGGEKLTGMKAARALKTSFEKAAEKLPFRTSGHVFFQVIKMDDNKYRLYAIDPELFEPEDRNVTLKVQLKGEFSIRDILSGEDIPVHGKKAQFIVPAGSLRILEAVRK
ncbi:MAG: hypothetical protein KAJ52_07420 [Sedimentisphaerales bacterium]|nr:hypothetical protein [Sedimentisphaerales bacterium]